MQLVVMQLGRVLPTPLPLSNIVFFCSYKNIKQIFKINIIPIAIFKYIILIQPFNSYQNVNCDSYFVDQARRLLCSGIQYFLQKRAIISNKEPLLPTTLSLPNIALICFYITMQQILNTNFIHT